MFTEMSESIISEIQVVGRWIMLFCLAGAALAARKGNAAATVPALVAAVLAGLIGYPEAVDRVVAFVAGLVPDTAAVTTTMGAFFAVAA